MKSRNLFWGLFFVAAAVFVVASQTGSFVQIGILSILATVLIVAIMIQSAVHRNFFGVLLPVPFLYLIYQQPLTLPQISFWLLMLAAVLAGTGLSIIFHTHPHHHWVHGCGAGGRFHTVTENDDDNNPSAKVAFGGSSRYLHGDCIQTGQFEVSFGSLEVFFDQAQLSPTGAEVSVEVSFGSLELYIPKTWRVIEKVRVSLGSVENDVHLSHPEADAPQLTITGDASFGSVQIHYI